MIYSRAMGDAHNFNRRVSYFEEHGKGLLEKPRCMFWEYLFLDPNSSFRVFIRSLDNSVNFDKILGSVSISSQNNFSTGFAEFVKASSIIDANEWLRSYGELLAFVSAFGITDLHRENILNIENRPRLIDLECVFWGAELPSETFLLPKNDFDWSKSIWISTNFEGLNSLSGAQTESILLGYSSVLNCLNKYSDDLIHFFSTLPICHQPIRILIEPTRDYRNTMDNVEPSLDYILTEEAEQMLRGDIPYFFGFSGKREIYFYDTPDTKTVLRSRKPIIIEKLNRAFRTPEELLCRNRLLRLKKQGIVEIAVRLLDLETLPYKSTKGSFIFEDHYLKVLFEELALQVKQGFARD